MKKLTFVVALLSFFSLISPALADEEIRRLETDLEAKGFNDAVWQENLESSQILFGPNDKFQLKVTIKNQGNRTQTQIKVTGSLPSTITTDGSLSYTIPEIKPGEENVHFLTVQVKGKASINKAVTRSQLTPTAKSEIGTESTDWLFFHTNNGTKDLQNNNQNLPATGSSLPLILGTIFTPVLAFTGFKLRKLARGY